MEKVAENGWKAKAIIIINKLYLHDLIKKNNRNNMISYLNIDN
jgi:hypothetical protein